MFCKEINIITLYLPAHLSHLFQPLEIRYFNPLKRAYGKALEDFIKSHIVTGRVACKQMVPKDEKRSIEGERKRENLTSQLRWALLFTGKWGSCLNFKAAKVSSGQEPGTQSGPRPVTHINHITKIKFFIAFHDAHITTITS